MHLPTDLAGQARFGPDVDRVSKVDYTVDLKRADVFYAAIRTYWPELAERCVAARLCRDPAEERRT
jgi:L-2-hydroxyglutarate oxidase LhgO